jgi:excisionase family DNA binding protein
MEQLLNSAQLAEYLNIKTVTVQRKAARGEIPSIRIGKRFRFDKQQISNWLQQNANGRQSNVLVSGDQPIKGVTGDLENEG